MPDYFRNVIAPARSHPKSFHLAGLHYHFTPTGGEVVLIILAVLLVAVAFKWLLRSSG